MPILDEYSGLQEQSDHGYAVPALQCPGTSTSCSSHSESPVTWSCTAAHSVWERTALFSRPEDSLPQPNVQRCEQIERAYSPCYRYRFALKLFLP